MELLNYCRTLCILHDLWAWYPGVGWYIAILGALGVAVTILRDLTKISSREKAVWIVITFGLLLLELRSIRLDRIAHDEEQSDARREQLTEFATIARGIDSTIQNSQNNFTATMQKSDQIMSRVSESIKSTTGGNSFCYVTLAGPISNNIAQVLVVHRGKYPMYGVDVHMITPQKAKSMIGVHATPEVVASMGPRYMVGNLPGGNGAQLESPSLHVEDQNDIQYNATIDATNGSWFEILRIRWINGKWESALSVQASGIPKPKKKAIFCEISKGFPRLNGKVNWGWDDPPNCPDGKTVTPS